MSRRAATLAVTGQHRGESASTSVGRGIPDAPMAQFVRGRQGCRPLRCCWSMVHTSGGTHRSRPTSIVGGTFVLMGWQMVPAVHPHRGRRRGPWPLAGDCAICGWRFGALGGFARCGGRVFRAVRGAGISPATADDQRLCLWKPRFGQRAAGWQEVSARNFVSEQGAALQPYWMYGKKLGRSYGAKDPATPADTPVVSCPTEKNRVKLLSFFPLPPNCETGRTANPVAVRPLNGILTWTGKRRWPRQPSYQRPWPE